MCVGNFKYQSHSYIQSIQGIMHTNLKNIIQLSKCISETLKAQTDYEEQNLKQLIQFSLQNQMEGMVHQFGLSHNNYNYNNRYLERIKNVNNTKKIMNQQSEAQKIQSYLEIYKMTHNIKQMISFNEIKQIDEQQLEKMNFENTKIDNQESIFIEPNRQKKDSFNQNKNYQLQTQSNAFFDYVNIQQEVTKQFQNVTIKSNDILKDCFIYQVQTYNIIKYLPENFIYLFKHYNRICKIHECLLSYVQIINYHSSFHISELLVYLMDIQNQQHKKRGNFKQ